MEPQNEFAMVRAPSFPYNSKVQVPVNHDFSEKFDRGGIDRKELAKVSFTILLLACVNFSFKIYLTFFFISIYLKHVVRLQISLVRTGV